MAQEPSVDSPNNMQKGFAMLLSVLILAVVGVAISTTLLSLSISSTQTATTLHESQKAGAAVEACVEKALQLILTSPSYTGTGSATLGTSGCTYAVSQVSTSNSRIHATSTVGQTTRKVLVQVTVPQRVIMTWQEI